MNGLGYLLCSLSLLLHILIFWKVAADICWTSYLVSLSVSNGTQSHNHWMFHVLSLLLYQGPLSCLTINNYLQQITWSCPRALEYVLSSHQTPPLVPHIYFPTDISNKGLLCTWSNRQDCYCHLAPSLWILLKPGSCYIKSGHVQALNIQHATSKNQGSQVNAWKAQNDNLCLLSRGHMVIVICSWFWKGCFVICMATTVSHRNEGLWDTAEIIHSDL